MKPLYESIKKKQCCACSACISACPQQCITMEEDNEGFYYPEIDTNQCIRCGTCELVCPILSATKQKVDPECYVGFSKDKNVRKNSSSGGIFTELAKLAIDDSGLVYGALFDENFNVRHGCIDHEKDIAILRGSKYVQSNFNGVCSNIKFFLKQRNLIYFSGTPCQVAGLYSFLGCRPENLFTQDLICHGVGSPLVWKKYSETYRNIKKAEFRNKKYGWHYFSMHIETEKKNTYKRLDEDLYLKLFLDNLILRPICYDCPFKKVGSQADITLGDCWNVQNVTNCVSDYDEGLSLILVNTEKGQQWIERLKGVSSVELHSVLTQKAQKSQPALTQSVACPNNRKEFFWELEQGDFRSVANRWCKISPMGKMKTKYVFIKTKIKYALAKKHQ